MSKWQPIETAPKDGTEIMVWVVKRKKPRGCLLVWFDDESNDWVNAYGGIRFDLEFTHWMPLPEAPVD